MELQKNRQRGRQSESELHEIGSGGAQGPPLLDDAALVELATLVELAALVELATLVEVVLDTLVEVVLDALVDEEEATLVVVDGSPLVEVDETAVVVVDVLVAVSNEVVVDWPPAPIPPVPPVSSTPPVAQFITVRSPERNVEATMKRRMAGADSFRVRDEREFPYLAALRLAAHRPAITASTAAASLGTPRVSTSGSPSVQSTSSSMRIPRTSAYRSSTARSRSAPTAPVIAGSFRIAGTR
jgi:hypothetical protein